MPKTTRSQQGAIIHHQLDDTPRIHRNQRSSPKLLSRLHLVPRPSSTQGIAVLHFAPFNDNTSRSNSTSYRQAFLARPTCVISQFTDLAIHTVSTRRCTLAIRATPAEQTWAETRPQCIYNEETLTFYPLTGIRPMNPQYMSIAQEEPSVIRHPPKKLVVLDLNGTLFHRSENKKRNIHCRPFLKSFLKFLFSNFRVMIWSSARPESIRSMLKAGFSDQQIVCLDRVWSRDHFDLHQTDYYRKVLTLKDLEKLWRELEAERGSATLEYEDLEPKGQYRTHYDQTNTILLDDSLDKSQLEPHNCVVLTDFEETRAAADHDIELIKVQAYLEHLIPQKNVSAYIRKHPYNPASEEYKSTEFTAALTDLLFQEALKTSKNAVRKAALARKEAKAAKKLSGSSTTADEGKEEGKVRGVTSPGSGENTHHSEEASGEKKKKSKSTLTDAELERMTRKLARRRQKIAAARQRRQERKQVKQAAGEQAAGEQAAGEQAAV